LSTLRPLPGALPTGRVGHLNRREDRDADPAAEVPDPTGPARTPRETRTRVYPARHPGVDRLVRDPDRGGGLEPGADPHLDRLCQPPQDGRPPVPELVADYLGHGQPEHPLEPRSV